VIKRSHLVRLRDILENIDAVTEMTAGVELAVYRGDFKLKRAVERCVEIISEATRHIPGDWKAQFAEQPWHEIAAIGNLLRHHLKEWMISSCRRSRLDRLPSCGRLSWR
jgi:uncharacterized protein with HEPN domain